MFILLFKPCIKFILFLITVPLISVLSILFFSSFFLNWFCILSHSVGSFRKRSFILSTILKILSLWPPPHLVLWFQVLEMLIPLCVVSALYSLDGIPHILILFINCSLVGLGPCLPSPVGIAWGRRCWMIFSAFLLKVGPLLF